MLRRYILTTMVLLGFVQACSAQQRGNALLDPRNPAMNQTAPATYQVLVSTSKGDFTIKVTREWAPKGADRFYSLVKNGFYNDARFFRVLRSPRPFMAQFGVNGDPAVAAKWSDANIDDDPVTQHNTRGMISFATAGPNTRSTQLFINYGDNSRLDQSGFSPFGQVVTGMEVVDQLYADYGEGAPDGKGPDQSRIEREGNAYLNRDFPKLDYIKTARVIE
ncbi:MAG TPA: peptidylprolyl isomerase [Terriglobia bacterium]|nr:peptidylprolyl isomerase [Terriglobia bacterium]